MPGVEIRKDDMVRVIPTEGRVMVDGVALAKKHQRAGGQVKGSNRAVQQGGIIDVEMFVDISNVQPVCKSCGQPTRVGHRIEADGSKVRICRKCEAEL